MTTTPHPNGQAVIDASSEAAKWKAINWRKIERQVFRLQMRIAKATREKRWNKVRALQWMLTHSHSAKLMAVRRVTRSSGGKTPGVDGVVWKTHRQKWIAAQSLRRHGYNPLPLKRIYILKKNGKQRPLGIPVMATRAQQALYLLALEPVAETLANPNTYGFRPKRSAADAIAQCFNALAQKQSARWVLEGDIKACYDQINHAWLEKNIPMDKTMLKKWLKAGYMEKGILYPTEEGTPQGGIISPCLANMTLRGLETVARNAGTPKQKLNVIVYADDFVVTGTSKEVLEDQVKPAIEAFLKERGLELSKEKTKITQIEDGFDFLGFNVRKYSNKLLIKPAKAEIKRFLQMIREMIKTNKAIKTEILIQQLNEKIRGWANYYRHVVSKRVFSYVDSKIFQALWAWVKRRHPKKSAEWCKQRYYRCQGLRNWVFSVKTMNKAKEMRNLDLFLAASLPIIRHVKIRSLATPYDPTYREYFKDRAKAKRRNYLQWERAIG